MSKWLTALLLIFAACASAQVAVPVDLDPESKNRFFIKLDRLLHNIEEGDSVYHKYHQVVAELLPEMFAQKNAERIREVGKPAHGRWVVEVALAWDWRTKNYKYRWFSLVIFVYQLGEDNHKTGPTWVSYSSIDETSSAPEDAQEICNNAYKFILKQLSPE